MEIKKSEKANLENKKLLFVEIGLVVSLGITLLAFEWTTKETETAVLEDNTEILVEEEMISTQMETPPPPPAAPKIPVLSDQIDIVDDEIEIEDDMFMNLEDDASLGVEIMDYVEVEEEVVEEEAIPFHIVETKPSFQGGDANQAMLGFRSCRIALFSIWRIRSGVVPRICPTSARVKPC